MRGETRMFALIVFLGVLASGDTLASGNVVAGRYVSPLHNFTVPVPDWKALKVQEHNDADFMIVAFLDRGGLLPAPMWSVASLRLDPEMAPQIEESEQREAVYQRFLAGFVMPYVFQNVASKTSLSNEAFVGEEGARDLFAVANIPEGHAFLRNPKKKKQDDSVSGLLIFHADGFMYLIRCEMKSVINADLTPATLTEKDLESVQEKLQEIKASIEFPARASEQAG